MDGTAGFSSSSWSRTHPSGNRVCGETQGKRHHQNGVQYQQLSQPLPGRIHTHRLHPPQPSQFLVDKDRWFKPFNDTDPTSLTFVYPLFHRVDGTKVKGKLDELVRTEPLKVQTRPEDGSTDVGSIGWDRISMGTILCIRVLVFIAL